MTQGSGYCPIHDIYSRRGCGVDCFDARVEGSKLAAQLRTLWRDRSTGIKPFRRRQPATVEIVTGIQDTNETTIGITMNLETPCR